MYERFYQLRERPFSLSPDPDYLYPSRVHQEALNYLRYGIEGHYGFVVITGEIGSGKTTLLHTLLRTLDQNVSVSRIMNTMLEPHELIEAVALDFGLPTAGMSKAAMIRELGRFLAEQRAAGRVAVLVIDEAQNLSLPALEEIRMLSNIETEKAKLIQIALVGQPDLRNTLARPELEQLRQRITVSYHLQPLDAPETRAYINHRLRKAALGEPLQFPPEATRVIHDRSNGLPRMINVICDSVLLFGFGEEKTTIDAELVEFVVADLEATGVLPARQFSYLGAAPMRPATTAAGPARQEGSLLTIVGDSDFATDQFASELPADEVRDTVHAAPQVVSASALEEQQRVLAEEYRLLRELTERARRQSGSEGLWPPLAASHDASPDHRQSTIRWLGALERKTWLRWWDRVRRMFTGEPA